jgi:hypothetical protein
MTASQLGLYLAQTGALVIDSIRVIASVAKTIRHSVRFIVALALLRHARVIRGDAGRVADPSQRQLRVIRLPPLKAPEFASGIKWHRDIRVPLVECLDRVLAIIGVFKFDNSPPTGYWGCRVD